MIELTSQLRYNAKTDGTGFLAFGEGHSSAFGLGQITASYITGSHAFKAGFLFQRGYQTTSSGNGPFPYNYQLFNGVPRQIQEWVSPTYIESWLAANVGVYAQDQWTLRKLTITAGLRFDYNKGKNPAQTFPAGMFTPTFSFPEQKDLPNWKDFSLRLGGRTTCLATARQPSRDPSAGTSHRTPRAWRQITIQRIRS